jgi:hypothetical protein
MLIDTQAQIVCGRTESKWRQRCRRSRWRRRRRRRRKMGGNSGKGRREVKEEYLEIRTDLANILFLLYNSVINTAGKFRGL